MPIHEAIVIKVLSKLVDSVEKRITRNSDERDLGSKLDLENALRLHLSDLSNWASEITVPMMTRKKFTDDSTIPLRISDLPRKFRKSNVVDGDRIFVEDELLKGHEHLLITGDPGAGKTTTIKRLCLRLLHPDDTEQTDCWQYPLVLVLRRQETAKGLVRMIADELGVPYEIRPVLSSPETEFRKLETERGTKNKRDAFKKENPYNFDELDTGGSAQKFEYYSGTQKLSETVQEILDETECLLLVDGLDEVQHADQERLIVDLFQLGIKLNRSKIVVTVRSGAGISIEGFNLFEICPLSPSEIEKICALWSPKSQKILEEIEKREFGDLCSRPLFLTYLILIFEHQGELPKKPSHVYRRVLRMFLEDWNRRPGVERPSRYANFDSDTQLEILCAFAYEVLFVLNKKVFNEDDLIVVYEKVHERFDMPQGEARNVAQELETHTGIIAQVDIDHYEFSHLSLMEYLAGQYVSMGVDVPDVLKLIEVNAAACAVSVGISSNPSDFLGRLLLCTRNYNAVSFEKWGVFLGRCGLERPGFERNILLGNGMLRLLSRQSEKVRSAALELCEHEPVQQSLCDALAHFGCRRLEANSVNLKRETFVEQHTRELAYLDSATIPISILETAVQGTDFHGVFNGMSRSKEFARLCRTERSDGLN